MELKDFIKSTLVEIALGVREANEELSKLEDGTGELFKLRRKVSEKSASSNVEFDVALTAGNDQKDKAGFFVALANVGGGANTEKGTTQENAHRVRFEVNISENWR